MNPKTKKITLILLFTITLFSLFPVAHAMTYGEITYYGSATHIDANQVSGSTYTIALLDSDDYLAYVYMYGRCVTTTVYIKCVVYDEDLAVVNVSDPVAVGGTYSWTTFNMTSLNIHLDDGENYTFGFISSGAFYHSLSAFFAPYYGLTDINNNYGTPEAITDATVNRRRACYYSTFNGTESVEPEPDPSATAAATTPPLDTEGSLSSIANFFVALALLLIPAGVLYWLKLGTWGILIGLLVGSGLGWIFLPAIMPLWLFVAIIIAVIGYVFKGSGGDVPQ